jgi:hypothetical protein
MPVAPASMFFTNRSCPGTSTSATFRPEGSVRCAKPKSMEMPRSFSSFRRSVSMPERRRTSAVLPWSMCPAVPMTTGRIRSLADGRQALTRRIDAPSAWSFCSSRS